MLKIAKLTQYILIALSFTFSQAHADNSSHVNSENKSVDNQLSPQIETTKFSIEIGTFRAKEAADSIISKLKRKGVEAYCFLADDGVYSVRFGDFTSVETARNAVNKLVTDRIIVSNYNISNKKVTPDFYAIIVGPFKDRNYIDVLDKNLKSAGIMNYSLTNYDVTNVVVYFGNYPSKSRAESAAKKLLKNKVLSRYDIVGRDNEDLTREAKVQAEKERKEANKKTSPESIRMEKYLKSARYRNLFEARCEYNGPPTAIMNDINYNIQCILDFSILGKIPVTQSPFKYQHEIQAIVAEVAGALAHRETAGNFIIQTRGTDGYVPMTSWEYTKYFDSLDVW